MDSQQTSADSVQDASDKEEGLTCQNEKEKTADNSQQIDEKVEEYCDDGVALDPEQQS